jgi:putative membrane protein
MTPTNKEVIVMKKLLALGTLTLALGVAPTLAQAPPADPDHLFVYNTYANGMAEIELGKLAQQKASSADVKKFADRLVTDHGRFNDELKTIATQKKITLPTEVDAKHKATYDRLNKLSGNAFDRAFMMEMVTAHRTAADGFKQRAAEGKDADIKAWATKTLPTIEEHLKAAQSVNTAVGTTGTDKK